MVMLVFDDTAPQLRYFGAWITGGSPNEFNSTAHGTRERGASVEVSFIGTSVAVRGTVSEAGSGAPPPISTYVLDGGQPATFSPNPTETAQYKQLFFQSQVPNGTHSLSITSSVAGSLFWLDYITVNSGGGYESLFSTAAISTPRETKPALSPATIIGIAIGGAFLFVSVLGGLVYFCINRKRRGPTDKEFRPRAKSVLTPRRKERRVTAFISKSTKQIPVVPPLKADTPPVSTNRYDYPPAKLSIPKPAAQRQRSSNERRIGPPLTALPSRRPRLSNGVGQGHSPPRRTVFVVNNM